MATLFQNPDTSSREWANGVYNTESGLVKFRNVGWFTNLDLEKRHEQLTLYKQYTPEEYPHYDNYDAINVNKVSEIPYDYDGAMGVPITFLDKYNPDQFEILGLTSGRNEFEAVPTKRYKNPVQINKNGSMCNGSKANTRATLLLDHIPNDIYYIADNADDLKLFMQELLSNERNLKMKIELHEIKVREVAKDYKDSAEEGVVGYGADWIYARNINGNLCTKTNSVRPFWTRYARFSPQCYLLGAKRGRKF